MKNELELERANLLVGAKFELSIKSDLYRVIYIE